jgi:long-chain fatty acid transport protein
MQKVITFLAILAVVVTLAPAAFATNGTNLIAVGPISRSMGGTGIAAPQDAISAVFSNPAGMCFGPYCPGSEFNFAGSLFMPDVSAKVKGTSMGTVSQDSDDEVYMIPAIGVSAPVRSTFPYVRMGLAAFGVSGLGVDYRDSKLDNPTFYDFGAMGQFPLVSGEFSQLQIMRFAPSIAVQPWEKLSFGASALIDYTSLDLRQGSEFTYGVGGQFGLLFQATDYLALGLRYNTPIGVTHDNVRDLDGDGNQDNLDIAAPQELGLGAALNLLDQRLLLEANTKWINWEDADGYEDFDWEDQWVFALGAQYEVVDNLHLRAGYNYAEHPVNEHDNFDGTRMVSVQGKRMPGYYYETFRIIGLPAIVEHHVTLGIGYEFSNKFSMHLGYLHAFENDIDENGTDITGQPVNIESELSEDSLEFGLTWRF